MFGPGGVFLFLLFGRGACFFCCLDGGVFIFGLLFVWGGGGACLFFLFCFCCLGIFVCFVLLFGRGTGIHSLTGLHGSSLRDPPTKKTKQQNKKQKHGFHLHGVEGLNCLPSPLSWGYRAPDREYVSLIRG